MTLSQLNVAEIISHIHGQRNAEVEPFLSAHHVISTKHWKRCQYLIESNVIPPLRCLNEECLPAPRRLIEKRADKLLDLSASYHKIRNNSDQNRKKRLLEENERCKRHFEALDQELLKDLPALLAKGEKIVHICTLQFVQTRKIFAGLVLGQLLPFADKMSSFKISSPVEKRLSKSTFYPLNGEDEPNYRVTSKYYYVARGEPSRGSSDPSLQYPFLPLKMGQVVKYLEVPLQQMSTFEKEVWLVQDRFGNKGLTYSCCLEQYSQGQESLV